MTDLAQAVGSKLVNFVLFDQCSRALIWNRSLPFAAQRAGSTRSRGPLAVEPDVRIFQLLAQGGNASSAGSILILIPDPKKWISGKPADKEAALRSLPGS